MHDLPLITTIAAAFTSALLLGLLTQRLGLSPIVGYLIAGVLIGPHSPGFVGDIHLANQLAEVGVILLMFGVGLHFHVKDLLAVRAVAIPGALGQSLIATLLGIAVFWAFGLPLKSGIVIGMALSVASTVVLMRVLMDAGTLNTSSGHIAVGWLLVEDVLTVIVLVIIPLMGGTIAPVMKEPSALGLWASVGIALLKMAILVLIVMVGGAKVIPWLLVQVTRLRSRELFTLTVLVVSIAIATGSYLFFGASMALGAFLAGMVVAQSPVSHQAAADALPMRDAFAVLFFVSVGMIFDPRFIVQEPLMILAVLGVILIAKPLTALVIVAVLGYSVHTALTVALGLAQVGEFSFILSELARKHGVMPDSGHNVLVAAAIISITLNPMLFRSLGRIEDWLRRHPTLWNLLNARAERRVRQTNQAAAEEIAGGDADKRLAIVVGFGPVGRSVDRLLREAGLSTVIVDMNLDTVAEVNEQGRLAIFGDASHDSILEQAGVKRASHLVLTIPQSSERATVVSAARNLNRDLRILVRARYLGEREDLEHAGASAAVFEEAEAAIALSRLVLADTGASRDVVERTVRDLRLRLIRENVSNLAAQLVRSVMVPWTRVQRISSSASLDVVRRQVAEHRFSRWPVVDPGTGRPVGYLLAKDLVGENSGASDWMRLVRPVRSVRPDDSVESTLLLLQQEGSTMCVVEDGGSPVGIITVEDILEQVVGRIEDEYPRHPRIFLRDAIQDGGIILDLLGRTPEQAIAELAGVISADRLPRGADVAALAIERERDMSTDVGFGVAIPHALCPNLGKPLVVFGRSEEGILFSSESPEAVRLIFLLVTPAEKHDLQVMMLGQIASLAGKPAIRERLSKAASPSEILEIFSGAEQVDK